MSGQPPSDANYDFMWAEYQKAMDAKKAAEAASMEISPEPGFVAKVTCQLPAQAQSAEVTVWINVCQSQYVAEPSETDDGNGGVRVRLPLSCGPPVPRRDADGFQEVVFDVVLHPSVVARCLREKEFRETVCDFALQNVQRKFPVQKSGKFRFPQKRYEGTRPAKQRIRKSGAAPKVQPISTGVSNPTVPSGAAPAAATASTAPDAAGETPPSMFQAKMPEFMRKRAMEPALSKEEQVLFEQFKQQMPDLKPSELKTAFRMYARKQAADKAEFERRAKQAEDVRKKAAVIKPNVILLCRADDGTKMSLERFLGRRCVRAAFENIPDDVRRRPASITYFLRFPKIKDLSPDSINVRLSESDVVIAERVDDKQESVMRGRYGLRMLHPFPVDTGSATVKFNRSKQRFSVHLRINQPQNASKKNWRKALAFSNPFVYSFVR